jgi:hypothetical protein
MSATTSKSHWLLWTISVLGVFSTVGTLAGLVIEKKLTTYAAVSALGFTLATMGFLFLVGWAYFKGDLNNVEAPKNRVLRAEWDEK